MKNDRNELKQPKFRLIKYYTYFSNKDFTLDENIEEGCSISALSVHLGLPVTVVRRDVAALFGMPENGYIWFDTDKCDTDTMSVEDICKRIISGEMDDVPVVSALPFYYTNAELPVAMKESEAELLEMYIKGISTDMPGVDTGYRIKQSYRFHQTEALTERLLILNEAIAGSYAVKLRYHDPRGKKDLNIEVYPVQLLYDATDNIYAVVAAYDDFRHLFTYRLDRMIYVSASRGKMWDPAEKKYRKLLDKLKYAPVIWDMNYEYIHPVHVKVSFQDTGNVWEKVRRELAYRTNGTLTETESDVFGKKEKVLVYEDKVSGLKSFKTWVLGYGRSAFVHGPRELRDEIVEMLERMAGRRGDG